MCGGISEVILAEIVNKSQLSNLSVISFKNDTIVYKASYINRNIILKIHKNITNYKREIASFHNLNGTELRVPELLYCENMKINQNEIGYLIEECLTGNQLSESFCKYSLNEKERILYDVGETLGILNYAISEQDLLKCGLWKLAYEGVDDFHEYNWIKMYQKSIPEWIHIIRESNSLETKIKTKIELKANLLLNKLHLISNSEADHFIHRDYGFRNILVDDNKITGIIDFEHAILGDATFDLSKLIFNDIDFEVDKCLRDAFFKGWMDYTGHKIDWEKLWIYLGLQGLGAIQWVERQRDYRIRKDNRNYMTKGLQILDKACENIVF